MQATGGGPMLRGGNRYHDVVRHRLRTGLEGGRPPGVRETGLDGHQHRPGSSTHAEDDWIGLRSKGPEMDPATLSNLLTELGMTASEYIFDNQQCGHKAETFVNDKWWDACPDPRGLLAVALAAGRSP